MTEFFRELAENGRTLSELLDESPLLVTGSNRRVRYKKVDDHPWEAPHWIVFIDHRMRGQLYEDIDGTWNVSRDIMDFLEVELESAESIEEMRSMLENAVGDMTMVPSPSARLASTPTAPPCERHQPMPFFSFNRMIDSQNASSSS